MPSKNGLAVRHFDLPEDQVHVWFARLDGVENMDDRYYQLLSMDEQERAGRFRFDRDRFRYIRSRAICRLVLASYCQAPARELVFEVTPEGKPYLSGPRNCQLHFNLSHSGDALAVGVARGREVGVDIELTHREVDWRLICRQYFHQHEIRAIESLASEGEQVTAFFRVWTQKEAYLKAVGKGIAGGLDQVEIGMEVERDPEFVSLPGGEGEKSRWQVFSLKPATGLIGYVVVEKENHPVRLVQYEWTGSPTTVD